jgi:DNA-binding CsgD family transcriptional regulator
MIGETPDSSALRCQNWVVAAPSAYPSAFVGRNRELGIIRSLLDRTAIEEAQAMVVSGDAGVGKTALVAEACAARAGSRMILSGACLPLTSMSIPLLPIRSAVRGLAGGIAPFDLGDADGDGDGGGRDVAVRFDAWLDRRCEVEPVVLVIDDVQWGDRSTLDVLMYLIAGPARRRLAVIATLRAGEIGLGHPLQRWLADVRRLPRTSELALQALDRSATGEQIATLIGGPPHQSLIDDVYGHTQGNPYFTRLLVAGLPADARSISGALPADLSSAVLQSWYRLSDSSRRLATVLAIGGRAMRVDELARIVGGDADAALLRASLEEGVDSGTLDRREDGSFWFHHPLNAEVLEATLGEDERRAWHRRFADDLVARVGGAALDLDDAVALADHRFAAGQQLEALVAALAAADAAGAAAARSEQLRLLTRAARLREHVADHPETVGSLMQRVREIAAEVGAIREELDAVEVLRSLMRPETDPLATAELLVRRMHLRFMAGEEFVDVPAMREAVRLASTDPASGVHALALAELAVTELWTGGPDAAVHAERAVEVARSAGDRRALAHALTAVVMVAEFDEASSKVHDVAAEAVRVSLESGDWFAYVHALLWYCNVSADWATAEHVDAIRDGRIELETRGGPHAYLAWLSAIEATNFVLLGRWPEARAALRFALGSDPGPFGDIHARLAAALLAAREGRRSEAESHLLRVDELMSDGSAFRALEYDAVRAEVRLGAGDPRAAFAAAMTGATAEGSRPTMCEWLMPLAARSLADLVERARDRSEPTLELLEQLDELERRFPEVLKDAGQLTPGWARQLQALQALYDAERRRARDDEGEASAWDGAADRLAACGFAWEEAYARWRGAEAMLGRAGSRGRGAELLRGGLDLARRLGARPIEAELRDLAHRARVPIDDALPVHGPADGPLAGLTEREREVLAHIAVGRTYSEIARALMISEKTVSTHVSHLLDKTGTANRVELASLAHRVSGGAAGG